MRTATNAVVAANATGQDPIAQVRRQTPALQGALRVEIGRSHLEARAAGRHVLEGELGTILHAAPTTLVEDDAFAEIVAHSLAATWGQKGLSLLSGNATTITAAELDQLAALVDANLRRAAATEVARAFNSEREALFPVALGRMAAGGAQPPQPPGGPEFPHENPAPGAFKVWSALLDGKTCPRCFALDGEIVELHRSFSAGSPPLHPHCRCIVEHLLVPRPQRLEDIRIDYDLFKEELRDIIREGRLEDSQRHALGFASESLGAQRSPVAITKRFADERYATRPVASGGSGPKAPPPAPPSPPRNPPPPGPPGGGSGSGGDDGSGGRRSRLTFVEKLSIGDVHSLKASANGPIEEATALIFRGRCPDAKSWRRLFHVPKGYEVRFHSFSASEAGLSVDASLVKQARRGEPEQILAPIGRLFRRDDQGKLVVDHDVFMIRSSSEQNKGVGEVFTRAALRGYRQIGVAQVDLRAVDIGRYTWASFGWSWPQSEAEHYRSTLETFLVRRGIPQAEAVAASETALVGAHQVAQLRIDGQHVGKEFLLGHDIRSWNGSLSLVPGPENFGYARAKTRLKL